MIQEKTDINLEDEIFLEEPKLYKVLLLNDDYTSMEFVIMVLMEIFGFENNKAMATMYKIHEKGSAVCGVYTYEIAEAKVVQVHKVAKEHEYPLRAVMEEE